MRGRFACVLLLLLLPWPASAEEKGTLGMSYAATTDMQLIWFEGLDYLVPHVVQTFTNALAWQRRTLGWTPSRMGSVMISGCALSGQPVRSEPQ